MQGCSDTESQTDCLTLRRARNIPTSTTSFFINMTSYNMNSNDILAPLPLLESIFYRRPYDRASDFSYHNHILHGPFLR